MKLHPIVSKYLVFYPYFLLNRRALFKLTREFDETQWVPGQDLYRKQWKRLKDILEYSYENVPFYKNTFDSLDIHPTDIHTKEDLLKLPVLTREDIRNNLEELKSTQGFRRSYRRQTSGSSGSPLHLAKDSECSAAMDAVMFRNYRWYGIELGQKEARYWGSPLSLTGRVKVGLKDYLLNRIRFSPFDVSESACRSFVDELRRFAPDYIYGYAQTIYRFAEFVLKADIDLSDLAAKAVIVTGEMISLDQIERIKEAFKCPVSNEYGCTEVGIIAMTCSHDRMHLMADNLFVEFMNNGKHSEPGEEGEIIVTELYGRLMPLIRYQVGDVGYCDDGVCSCGRGLPLVGGIKGRNDEFILCANGKQIDPIIFEYILADVPDRYGRILQFRITQEKGFKLNIEAVYEGRDFQAMIRLIQERLQRAVGPEFDIAFFAMETIQAEASGKLRCFISRVKD